MPFRNIWFCSPTTNNTLGYLIIKIDTNHTYETKSPIIDKFDVYF